MIHNIAHRGASAFEPENTLRAFARAYVHLCWEKASPTPHKSLAPELISDIRHRGLGVVLWHEERPAELRELVKSDADGICTNTPDVLAAILKEQKGQICYP